MDKVMDIIIKPIVTERMTWLGDAQNRYGFVVNKNANKIQIKKAVEDMYSVSVTNVNTMVYAGKEKMRYTKSGIINGSTKAFKKAIVTVAEGDKIDFFSNI